MDNVFKMFESLELYNKCEKSGHDYEVDVTLDNDAAILRCKNCGYYFDFRRVD